jgi:hypothetical protein
MEFSETMIKHAVLGVGLPGAIYSFDVNGVYA